MLISESSLSSLQNDDFTEEKIRFGAERVYIDSWTRRRIYDAFKEILESGVGNHLQVRKMNKNLHYTPITKVRYLLRSSVTCPSYGKAALRIGCESKLLFHQGSAL